MNDRYIEYPDSSNFPEEAFNMKFDIDGPVEFNNSWLSHASEDEQLTALRDWFHARYCDPVHSTPYNTREGGYLFIHGGPYSPTDELNERFSEVVPQSVIDEVVGELECEVGDEWAPIDRRQDFDDYFIEITDSRNLSKERFEERNFELRSAMLLHDQISVSQLTIHMSYGMLISYLEAYLADSILFWAKKDDRVLYRLAIKEFDNKKYTLAEIFSDIKQFKENILVHFSSNVVWHRLDKLKATIEYGLNITLPDISLINEAMKNRHDIVHRGGFKKDGTKLDLSIDDFFNLQENVQEFVKEFDMKINVAFPKDEIDDFI